MTQAKTATAEATATATTVDLRRYIGNTAAPGQPLLVRIAFGIQVATGSWTEVGASALAANVRGEVPGWIPGIGGKKFNVDLSIRLLGGDRARVTVSGTVSGSAEGKVFLNGNELKVADLRFSGHLSSISNIALEPWHGTETRFSFYHVPGLVYWFRSWLVPADAANASSGDYPAPELPEGHEQ